MRAALYCCRERKQFPRQQLPLLWELPLLHLVSFRPSKLIRSCCQGALCSAMAQQAPSICIRSHHLLKVEASPARVGLYVSSCACGFLLTPCLQSVKEGRRGARAAIPSQQGA